MFEEAIAFFLGFLSVLSPCVLPILPIVFAGSKMQIKNSIILFFGLILSISLLSFISFAILGFRILAYALLIFLSIYLLNTRLELFVARKISKFSRVFKTRLPPFLLGFFLPFIWLPCIAPFLGIAISEAVLSERPLSISIFYILGFSTSVVVIIFLGRSLKINFEAIRKILGIAVLISTLYLILRQFSG